MYRGEEEAAKLIYKTCVYVRHDFRDSDVYDRFRALELTGDDKIMLQELSAKLSKIFDGKELDFPIIAHSASGKSSLLASLYSRLVSLKTENRDNRAIIRDVKAWLNRTFANSDQVSMAFSHLLERLGQAITQRKKYERTAKLFKLMNGSLLFGQYIVGAALGTSFLKLSLSAELVGILGTFVVISAAARQKYHPESVAADAETRAFMLEALVNDVEDSLMEISCSGLDAPDAASRLNSISHEISSALKQLKRGIRIPATRPYHRKPKTQE